MSKTCASISRERHEISQLIPLAPARSIWHPSLRGRLAAASAGGVRGIFSDSRNRLDRSLHRNKIGFGSRLSIRCHNGDNHGQLHAHNLVANERDDRGEWRFNPAGRSLSLHIPDLAHRASKLPGGAGAQRADRRSRYSLLGLRHSLTQNCMPTFYLSTDDIYRNERDEIKVSYVVRTPPLLLTGRFAPVYGEMSLIHRQMQSKS